MLSRLWILFAMLVPALAQQGWVVPAGGLPGYPAAALESETQGLVEVRCELNQDGTVREATAISGPPILRQAATENALTWRYRTGADGTSRSTASLVYMFVLGPLVQGEPGTGAEFRPPNRIRVYSDRRLFQP